ncbi:MAG: homoserine dehydrogenase [Dehalococcoidia bacterium]|nr:MAG: homoserine dehydrogenase [Dehalococcoidia bacterium]
MSNKEYIHVGLLGLGVIGTGVARTLVNRADELSRQVGCQLALKKALDCDVTRKSTSGIPDHMFTTDADQILEDPDIDIVVEVIGGDTDAFEYFKKALVRRKHVVTANKELISKHMAELIALATENNVDIRYEASVGGGIPIVSPLKQDLVANNIIAINAIINGTTNYIVTHMAAENMDFSIALKQAQELGYAEADPANDIEGIDAAYKLAILATIAFRSEIGPQDIYCEGISRLSSRDFRYARELGYAIKLLAIARSDHDSVQVRVHPSFIPEETLLANVDGVFNAIEVEGDLTGKVIFYGRGAGSLPTTSAIVSDVLRIAQRIHLGLPPTTQPITSSVKKITPISEIVSRYYMRLTIDDSPGVLAQISKILGDHLISIASVIQKEADEKSQTAEIVIMTHPARESAVQKAIQETEAIPVVKEIGNLIRVVD